MLRNIIGGQHDIDKDIWALSLVRKEKADHAYLILEGADENGIRIIEDFHLVLKRGSNNKKGEVVHRTDLAIGDLVAIGSGCSSYTWNVNAVQVQKLRDLAISEKKRAGNNEINYILFGDSALSGIVGASLEEMHSTESKNNLEKKSENNSSMDMLLRTGHNCGSWAIAMARALDLKFQGSWLTFIAVYPVKEIQGNHNGDEEPSTKCSIM